jgi:hypothetical protein
VSGSFGSLAVPLSTSVGGLFVVPLLVVPQAHATSCMLVRTTLDRALPVRGRLATIGATRCRELVGVTGWEFGSFRVLYHTRIRFGGAGAQTPTLLSIVPL